MEEIKQIDSDNFEKSKASYNVSKKMEWSKWMGEIPYIEWPQGWLVKAVPPFAGAVIRYWVTKKNLKGNISVYLDCYNILGIYSFDKLEPYWEIYPYDGDIYRCGMNETNELLKHIEEALSELEVEDAR